jgi:hypothetical protein
MTNDKDHTNMNGLVSAPSTSAVSDVVVKISQHPSGWTGNGARLGDKAAGQPVYDASQRCLQIQEHFNFLYN